MDEFGVMKEVLLQKNGAGGHGGHGDGDDRVDLWI